MNSTSYVGLDVGEKRIGVSHGESGVRIAVPVETILVDGSECDRIRALLDEKKASTLVVGYPRNQAGDATAQTAIVEAFIAGLTLPEEVKVVFQDESLTSVMAEQYLVASGVPYEKADIDARAAAIILQDYLETLHG